MRELTSHRVNPANDTIKIEVLDSPGDGGACHEYLVTLPSFAGERQGQSSQSIQISFQNGPIGEVGVNGLTHEVLLAILEDRLEGFQGTREKPGKFACTENDMALELIRAAQSWLKHRTKARMARGVEGTHEV
jgi:hypothetical protein